MVDPVKYGAACENRTRTLCLARRQAAITSKLPMVSEVGFEPTTFCMSRRRATAVPLGERWMREPELNRLIVGYEPALDSYLPRRVWSAQFDSNERMPPCKSGASPLGYARIWCCRSISKTRPTPYQGAALPLSYGNMVGTGDGTRTRVTALRTPQTSRYLTPALVQTTGFEPAISALKGRRLSACLRLRRLVDRVRLELTVSELRAPRFTCLASGPWRSRRVLTPYFCRDKAACRPLHNESMAGRA